MGPHPAPPPARTPRPDGLRPRQPGRLPGPGPGPPPRRLSGHPRPAARPRDPAAPRDLPLIARVTRAHWEDGKLHLTGYAYVRNLPPAASRPAARPCGCGPAATASSR
ncbi:hypothetical protein NQP46_22290 [Streptomyces albus]|nr:hypothetical protein NQP46_22290 [Streptomyces albus]